jgi:KAP family P-loop domain
MCIDSNFTCSLECFYPYLEHNVPPPSDIPLKSTQERDVHSAGRAEESLSHSAQLPKNSVKTDEVAAPAAAWPFPTPDSANNTPLNGKNVSTTQPQEAKKMLDPALAWPFPTPSGRKNIKKKANAAGAQEAPSRKKEVDPSTAWPFPPSTDRNATTQRSSSPEFDPTQEADLLAASGREWEAGEILKAALETDPSNSAIRRRLSGLRGHGSATANEDLSEEMLVEGIDAVSENSGHAAVPDETRFSQTGVGTRADQGPTRVERHALNDALDRGKITSALVQLISSRIDVAPIAIGLFGHWGSGKSSQIDFVKQELSHLHAQRIRFAEFNAWQHEKSENLGAALAQTVVEALVKDLGFIDQLTLSVQLATRRKSRLTHSLSKDAKGAWSLFYRWATVLAPLFGPAAVVTFAAFVVLANYQWPELNTAKNWVGSVSSGIAALWIGWHKFISVNLTQWFNRISTNNSFSTLALPDFSAKLGSFHEIHTTLRHLCALQLSGTDDTPTSGDYLFLVIDDLDRCTPLAVKQVFDAVRLVASIPRVVTLVAIDDRIAFAAVATHYDKFNFAGRDPGQVARDYLAKVFQVAITLPPVDVANSNRFIHSELFADELRGLSSSSAMVAGSDREVEAKTEVAPRTSEQLLSVLPEEVALFAHLANETAVSNPRELWRLKQAWFLLKGMALKDGDGLVMMKPWLQALFVREWELQAPMETRRQIEMRQEAIRAGTPPPNLDARIMKIINLQHDDGVLQRPFVDAVLLPSAPMEPSL